MVWGDASSRKDSKIDQKRLPAGFRDPHNQALMGVGLSLPEVQYVDDVSSGVTVPAPATEGERTWMRDISPAHRKVVRDYFKE